MPIATISTAFASLKEASSLLRGFNQLKTEAEVAAKTVELTTIISSVQQDLFDTQATYAAAIGEIDTLKAKLMAMENWAAEKQRYKLQELESGAFVYRLQEEKQNSEPIHDLCAQCYQQSIKSILQFIGHKNGFQNFSCNHCGSTILGKRVKSGSRVIHIPEPTLPRF